MHGDFTMLLPDDERVYAFIRRYGGTVLLVVANLSSERSAVPLPDGWQDAELVLGNVPAGEATDAADPAPPGHAVLGPWEARIHRRTT